MTSSLRRWRVRRRRRPCLIANKAEGAAGAGGIADAYGLGLGDPVALSAEHGEGLEDLYSALRPIADAIEAEAEAEAARLRAFARARSDASADEDADAALALEEGVEPVLEPERDPGKPLQIAVVGRPNAGKSTLVNRILGDDRLLTGPEPGVTRDAIGFEIDWGDRRFKIFDTAGMRKKAKVQAKLEKLSVGDALRAVRFAEVVVLLLDVRAPLETQDLKIADLAAREGRAVVIAVNKWDLEEARETRLAQLREEFDRQMPQLRGAPMVAVSGLTGRGVDRLREAVLSAAAAWDRRVPTAALNRWLTRRVERHPPPAPSGRRLRLRYLTQVKARPPTFALWASIPDALPESYIRFLVNGLREDFGLDGAPIRISLRTSDNPYAAKAKKRR